MTTPVFYSFRRCPYAMRARLALHGAGLRVELREVVLRDKPQAFLDASPSGTVPCLIKKDSVLDESLDVMMHALQENDPGRWLNMPSAGMDLIAENDGSFKSALDRTKYAVRYPDSDPAAARAEASDFLARLNSRINGNLFGRPTLADFAIFPFVRQFAFIDKTRFDAEPWPELQGWLSRHMESPVFAAIMFRYSPWQPGDSPVLFPDL